MDFIDMAITAKSGDSYAIEQLHNYYIKMAYRYYDKINQNERYDRKFNEMISSAKINNMFDYVKIYVFLASLSCKQYGCHPVIILNDVDEGGKAVSTTTHIDLSYLFGKIDKIILLTNETGQFTFDQYLKIHYAGYELISIPQDKSKYDNIEGCAIDFITHDVSHLRYVVGNEYISNALKHAYYHAIDDNLILMIIWMYIHENGFKESFHRLLHPFAYRSRIEFLSLSLQTEFSKYTDIIYHPDNVDSTLANLAMYISQYGKEYMLLKKYVLGLIERPDDVYLNFLLGLNYGYIVILG